MVSPSSADVPARDPVVVYSDGSCLGNPGPGGWGVVVFLDRQDPLRLSGPDPQTTNNRMELTAAIKGLEATPIGSTVSLYSDSQYLVNTMTRNWKRRKNHDLWERLDSLAGEREVIWHWIYGHAGDRWNEEADRLAVSAMKTAADGRAQARKRYERQS
jgi:ribonuclease HI